VNGSRIVAILLGAGESTRMGRLKQLLPWDGEPLIAWQVRQMQEAGADEVVVVLGHAANEIRPAVPATARVVVNESYREGRASSLRRGAEAVAEPVGAVLILSVDQPRPSWIARTLIERWHQDPAPIISPRIAGHHDHPVLIDGSLLPELRAVSEETLGLRAVTERHSPEAASVSIDNAEVAVDLNTPADYEAALAAFKRGRWNAPET
jgi:molybdenum cofactor cytidylyltransferase